MQQHGGDILKRPMVQRWELKELDGMGTGLDDLRDPIQPCGFYDCTNSSMCWSKLIHFSAFVIKTLRLEFCKHYQL